MIFNNLKLILTSNMDVSAEKTTVHAICSIKINHFPLVNYLNSLQIIMNKLRVVTKGTKECWCLAYKLDLCLLLRLKPLKSKIKPWNKEINFIA